MRITSSKAIVLSGIKYGDSSLIVKCFTEALGIKNFLIRGVFKSKKGKIKPAYFQPLTQLKITGNFNNKGHLNSIKEVEIFYPYQTIYKSIVKQSIVLFIAEILQNSIQEEETNTFLYNFLETSFIWLDKRQEIANFHLFFLYKLTSFLGFSPDTSEKNLPSFHLLEGSFSAYSVDKFCISGNELSSFKKLFEVDFESINNIQYNKTQRQQVLNILIQYFELHLNGFTRPKSLSVLKNVFN